MAEETVAQETKDVEDQRPGQWSDWDILDDQGFQALQDLVYELEARGPTVTAAEVQELRRRVREFGAGNPTVPVPRTQAEMQRQMSEVMGRVVD